LNKAQQLLEIVRKLFVIVKQNKQQIYILKIYGGILAAFVYINTALFIALHVIGVPLLIFGGVLTGSVSIIGVVITIAKKLFT